MSAPLSGGFAAPAEMAARAFRAALEAMARPGTLTTIEGAAPPAPLSQAAGALALTLLDPGTPLFLAPSHDTPEIRAWIAFHCSAPLVAPEAASFGLGDWESLQPLERFALGSPEFPDRSVTLFIERRGFGAANARLQGPGIKGEARFELPQIAPFQANRTRFPLGFDSYFTSGSALVGLPRSTKVEAL